MTQGRAGTQLASFEDRLTMVIAAEQLRGMHQQMSEAVGRGELEATHISKDSFGKHVIELVQSVVSARREDQFDRFGRILARSHDELFPFSQNPRGCIPFIAAAANALAALEECMHALVLAQDISMRMAKMTPVAVTKEDVCFVLDLIANALMAHGFAQHGVELAAKPAVKGEPMALDTNGHFG